MAARAQVTVSDANAVTVIRQCTEQASEDTLGLDALEAVCPGIEQALTKSGYLPLLVAEQRDQLTTDELSELLQIAERDRASDAVRPPRVDAVQPIVAALRQKPREHALTWRERLEQWWRKWTSSEQSAASPLSRWLGKFRLPHVVATVILCGLIVVVIGLAGAVLLSELRAAGVLRRRATRRANGVEPMPFVTVSQALDGDLDAVAPAQQVPLLLKKLVAALVRSGRLPLERSLTHRELGMRAVFDDVGERTAFQRLTELAERIVYGSGKIPPEDYEPVIAAGRALHARLREAGP